MTKLENFDELFVGDSVEIEKNLRALLPQAKASADKSIYLQILSRIALAQALQKKFDDAHKTLDNAEKLLSDTDHLARVRILLERGRVFHQSGKVENAKPLFIQSFELGSKHQLDEHTIDAAHMIAIVVEMTEEKIKWNERAIALAENSDLPRGHAWLASLYNNIGQAYLEDKQYEKGLNIFKKAQKLREKEGYAPNIRVAKWSVARAMRLLSRFDEALSILLPLKEEYDSLTKTGDLDMPMEMLPSLRGLVYEELAELHDAEAKLFARLAYEDLSKDEWFKKLEPERLERLKLLQKQQREPIHEDGV